ncbi:hypothetical protein FNL55_14675 [Tardiphaga sp. vice352]|uniref:DUF6894 family protein n=1 Tax=unclassified Tardiphaga TaxID=2631404 RepID=UPI0011656BCE|nr:MULTISPECIES: hypothetical protein [unclassified Tardiphaga]MBC7585300.1 hypothetical protein [Tardiphaga sp.]QDM17099.1 hypothetical protein FNL53_14960 [Tardiphaga sp. vice278]QDM22079.1 hypothetical protein FIU28_13615 [Tardiphaga sp. vice154]QDM27333.1 hypothetical protein FNL56_15270 [Tardiphaga sp. vice304]QDM32459.1 hypothetical protein FNL55_14675 [Tardiphaga sp. vice352]
MPKYHFEIVDDYRLEDPIGQELHDADQAMTVANDIAKQIATDVVSESARNVVVIDDSGTEVYQTPISCEGKA